MLRDWLGGTSLDAFRAHYLQRAPIAASSVIGDPRSLLDWDVLGAVLAAASASDVLVVAAGRHLPVPVPRSLVELRAYFRLGIGVCVQHTERCHRILRRIADSFECDLGQAQVQIFATPGGTHGFGWHYDDEDVFIVQTDGNKDYFFRDNTVERERPPVTAPDFSRFGNEVSPLGTARLLAGDWLYIPARWWHAAKCIEDSLSISLGIFPEPFWLSSIDK